MSHIPFDGVGELCISDIREAREGGTRQFDRVMTVCQDSIEDNVSKTCDYSWYNMSDGEADGWGGSSDYSLFEQAADELHDALLDGESVLIHCHRGRSRSVSVTVAALGRILDVPRHESFDTVEYYRPQAHPDKLLMEYASRYIDEQKS
jgi:protein-tyrosine phosphatase